MARRNDIRSTVARPLTLIRLAAALFALLLVTVPGAAFGASPMKLFGGTTSQTTAIDTFHITMNVDASKVSDLQFGAQVLKGASACAQNGQDGSSFVFTEGELAIANHRIAGKLKDELGNTVVVHAHVSRTSTTGSFVVFAAATTSGPGPCNSGVVKFVAQSGSTPPGGTAYSGTVGPGYLITFDVSPHATTVNNLVVAYDETCNGTPSDVTPTFRFKTLVIASGEFTGTTTESFGPAVSDTVHIAGTFSGGVAAGQVSDTSRVASFPNCTQTSQFVATAS
jgi:hypothetical protein